MLTPPQLVGQWAWASEAAEGMCSNPPLLEAADAGGMTAKHARMKAMAQTIALAELIVTPLLSLYARVLVD